MRLKTDSFVVESEVHFPTDYNLVWDCGRKCLYGINKMLIKYEHIKGWRKWANWRYELKGLMRALGKASSSGGKNKAKRVNAAAQQYIKKAKALQVKLEKTQQDLPLIDVEDLCIHLELDYYMPLLAKHIDLVERRVIKGEKIPHEEKMFSVFEPYTEWIKKGKSRPNVELGKKLSVTTDQYHLIVDYEIMTQQQDRDVVIGLADRMLNKYKVQSWSFDKGYWDQQNKEIL